ncbi:MAG TPA: outer membrane beta-barrel protein [Steroidobacter sp.]|nr:outer membrane beta-barrel protein [Steroidobacter sp.]
MRTRFSLAGLWPCALAAVIGLLVAPFAGAAEPPSSFNTFEITPYVGYMAGGEFEESGGADLDLDADTNLGVIFNVAADHWRRYELLYSNQGAKVDGSAPFDMDVEYLQIGGIVSHPMAERAIPYFGITVGATRFSPEAAGMNNETEFSFTVGAGLHIPITDHIGVRFDARAFVTLLDGDSEIFCASDNGAACRVRAKSDTFLQYAAALGVTFGF